VTIIGSDMQSGPFKTGEKKIRSELQKQNANQNQ
jgi:hypothetical protein